MRKTNTIRSRHRIKKSVLAATMAFTLIFGSVMTGPGHVNAAGNSQRSYEELSEAVEQAQIRLENAQVAQEEASSAYEEAKTTLANETAKIEKAGEEAETKKADWESAKSEQSAAEAKVADAQAAFDENARDIAAAQEALDLARQIENDKSEAEKAAQEEKDQAQTEADAANEALEAAKADIASEVPDPGSNEGHKEWTAYGLFQSIRDNAQAGSATYWDAQCAMDILDGGINSTGHSYPYNQGPAPDGPGASKWADIADNIAWAERADAVSLDNVRTSMGFLDEFNSIRDEENKAEGTSLRTDIGTNCRQMAISIVQCDTSKDYSTGHTQAYEGLENLSWSSGKGKPFSRSKYTDPYVGWYDEEKVNYKENNGGMTGHYETIVDLNSGYFCNLAGFAVCSYNASYGECRELSTFGDFFEYDTNPDPEQVYSVEEFTKLVNDYYDAQAAAGMFGTPQDVRIQHQTALADAQAAQTAAVKALEEADARLTEAKTAKDRAGKDLAAAQTALSDLQAKTEGLQTTLDDAKKEKMSADSSAEDAKAAYDEALKTYQDLKDGSAYTDAVEQEQKTKDALETANADLEAAKKVLAEARDELDALTSLADNPDIKVNILSDEPVYSGQAIEPEIEVVCEPADGDASIVSKDSYTISFDNNVNAGEATVTITGKGEKGSGSWWGKTSRTFTISKAESSITLYAQSRTYTGKNIYYSAKTVREGSTGKVSYHYYLDAACTRSATPKAAGNYYVKASLAGDDNYKAAQSDPVKLTITKAVNPIAAKGKKAVVNYKAVKKKAQTLSAGKILSVTKAKGAKTFAVSKWTSSKATKYLTLNKKTGRVTIKKRTPKGTYKFRVKVTAKGDKNYKSGSQSVNVVVQVK